MAIKVQKSYDNYDFSPAGFVTDYIIFMVGLLCGLAALWWRRKQQARIPPKMYLHFSFFSLIAALAFLYGGIGHMMIGKYAARSVHLGKQWGTANSRWMYAWLPAVSLMPASALANLSVIFAAYDLPDWTQVMPYVLGLFFGVAEVFLMSTEDLLTFVSGSSSVLSFLISSSMIIVMACIKALCDEKRGIGMWVVMGGNILIFVAWLLVASAPAGCMKYSETVRDCPYPNDFNQNAIFHVIIIIALVMEFFGVKRYAEEQEKHGYKETPGNLLEGAE